MAEKAAEIKGITPQEILDITCKNGLRLFEIDI
jgi:Tat protein secretion system quality control protein TatD with DNase activity